MITAIIRNKENTLVLELPHSIYDIYEKLQSIGIIERANQRVKRSTEEAFAGTVQGYSTVTAENSSVQFHGGKARYALYPVWLLNTTWNGNQYTFAMNGQTGKFVGDLPVDKAAASLWTIMLAAIFAAVTYGGAWLLHLIGLI